MNCDRCQGVMLEERLVVRGGLVKIKNYTAWYCMHCGRTEYISADQDDINPCTKDYSDPAAVITSDGERPKRREAGLS